MPSHKSATHHVDVQARELERLRADLTQLQQDNARLRYALRDAAMRARNMAEVVDQLLEHPPLAHQRMWLDKVLHESTRALDRQLARAAEDDEPTKAGDR